MRVVAIIQARMGSTRLPGKVLLPLGDKPAIIHVAERAAMIDSVDDVVVATGEGADNDPLVELCADRGIPVFRGSETDVLDRYYRAAEAFEADVIIRVTGDCPLLDPRESSRVVQGFRTGGGDYAANTIQPTLPDGLDTEVFRRDALVSAWRNAQLPSEREHATLYIYRHPERYRLHSITHVEDLSHHRWTLDEPDDYAFLKAVFAGLSRRHQFGHLSEVLALLAENPKLPAINRHIARNEGLARSIQNERE